MNLVCQIEMNRRTVLDIMGRLFELHILSVIIAFAVLLISLFIASIRITREHERGVVFRLGRLLVRHGRNFRGPGLVFIVPIFDRMVRVDLREETLDLAVEEALTSDRSKVCVEATVFFRVVTPADALVKVQDYRTSIWRVSQATLCDTVARTTYGELRTGHLQIGEQLTQLVNQQASQWGVEASSVKITGLRAQAAIRRGESAQGDALVHIQEELEHTRFLSRLSIGLLSATIGIGVILLASSVLGWAWLDHHPNRLGLYSSAVLIVCGFSWAIMDSRRRQFALGSLALGALLVLVQIIGG
jgi:hypothetical protein